jgi:hypothetical protein
LDEAIKSRVHISLYYPRPGKEETLQIFEMNLDRLRKIEEQRHKLIPEKEPLHILTQEIMEFAKKHYENHTDETGRWNGRQIRNAFQIASSLAHYDTTREHGMQPQLRKSHFETVALAVTSFDNFRKLTAGKSDSAMAYTRNERYDSYSPEHNTANHKANLSRRGSIYSSTFTRPGGGDGDFASAQHPMYNSMPDMAMNTNSPYAGIGSTTMSGGTMGPPPKPSMYQNMMENSGGTNLAMQYNYTPQFPQQPGQHEMAAQMHQSQAYSMQQPPPPLPPQRQQSFNSQSMMGQQHHVNMSGGYPAMNMTPSHSSLGGAQVI